MIESPLPAFSSSAFRTGFSVTWRSSAFTLKSLAYGTEGQDADVVMFLYREWIYDDKADESKSGTDHREESAGTDRHRPPALAAGVRHVPVVRRSAALGGTAMTIRPSDLRPNRTLV